VYSVHSTRCEDYGTIPDRCEHRCLVRCLEQWFRVREGDCDIWLQIAAQRSGCSRSQCRCIDKTVAVHDGFQSRSGSHSDVVGIDSVSNENYKLLMDEFARKMPWQVQHAFT
jgi:hypothetical protein